ncbi:YbdK family carboxylate-amine ligase [Microbacterium sp. NC79]|uniref:carboxylate-amine ligase n=1 Tax=Microbacterium sp. NC79 TaxID=2851009 RepID=UPI001C2C7B43|nr:YbdK family carboxylate-amine ligase [Microbacterium sp. NC79]MBV0894900.1 YbdK family carboxylate-amine ligase [Microbacterium sp. NC79]
MARSFGIEEEFMFADAESLTPVNVAHDAIEDLRSRNLPGTVTAEFLDCQIEFASGVCHGAAQALDELTAFRTAAQAWAEHRGLTVVPSGTPFVAGRSRIEPTSARYHLIAQNVGRLAGEHLLNGMHVHVGIDDPADRVRALGVVRPWLPALLAISANSPFWKGADTSFHSWRSIQARRWTTNGIPPAYEDQADHDRLRERLIGVGATQHYSTASWSVRVSENLPTIELRISDAQLTAARAVSIALVIRGLVDVGLRTLPEGSPERHHILDAELWHAARHGMSEGLYNPMTRTHTPSSDVLSHLVAMLHDSEEATPAFVDTELDTMAAGSDGATIQRAALARSLGHLTALYCGSMRGDED